jgi:hypothetical protein
MDIKELKNLLKNSTSVLVMEDGEPQFVIASYESYKGLIEGKKEVESEPLRPKRMTPIGEVVAAKEAIILERLNKEISVLNQQVEAEERGVLAEIE